MVGEVVTQMAAAMTTKVMAKIELRMVTKMVSNNSAVVVEDYAILVANSAKLVAFF